MCAGVIQFECDVERLFGLAGGVTLLIYHIRHTALGETDPDGGATETTHTADAATAREVRTCKTVAATAEGERAGRDDC